jgi:hypothetical protein
MGAQDVTRDELLAELAAFVSDDEPEGDGWYTAAEIYVVTGGVSIEAARRRLDRAVNAGLLERHKGSTRVWYRVKRNG